MGSSALLYFVLGITSIFPWVSCLLQVDKSDLVWLTFYSPLGRWVSSPRAHQTAGAVRKNSKGWRLGSRQMRGQPSPQPGGLEGYLASPQAGVAAGGFATAL